MLGMMVWFRAIFQSIHRFAVCSLLQLNGVESWRDEGRLRQVGETNGGLVVVTSWRGDQIRVVTAYPASKKIRTLYCNLKGRNYG